MKHAIFDRFDKPHLRRPVNAPPLPDLKDKPNGTPAAQARAPDDDVFKYRWRRCGCFCCEDQFPRVTYTAPVPRENLKLNKSCTALVIDQTKPQHLYKGVHVCEACFHAFYFTQPALQRALSERQEHFAEPPPPLEGEDGFIGPLPPTEAEQAAVDAERAAAASALASDPERVARLAQLSFTPWWTDGKTKVLTASELDEIHVHFDEFTKKATRYLYRNNNNDCLWREYERDRRRPMRTKEIKEYAALFGYELSFEPKPYHVWDVEPFYG